MKNKAENKGVGRPEQYFISHEHPSKAKRRYLVSAGGLVIFYSLPLSLSLPFLFSLLGFNVQRVIALSPIHTTTKGGERDGRFSSSGEVRIGRY